MGTIDTSAEVLGRVRPFSLPTDFEAPTSDTSEDDAPEEAEKEGAEEEESLAYSASGTQLALSTSSLTIKPDAGDERTPTPSKGYLDRAQSSEEVACVSPPRSELAVASPDKKLEGATQFRFSDYSVQGMAEIVDDGAEEYSSNVSLPDDEYIPDTTLNISLASWPPMTLDSDVQSTEVSHSPSAPLVEVKDESTDGAGVGKKKKHFSLGGKKRRSIKNMLPRWKKSKDKGARVLKSGVCDPHETG